MSENKYIEYFPPNPLLKAIIQYLVGIISGALGALFFVFYFFRSGQNQIAELISFLLIAVSFIGGMFGGLMVFLTKLNKQKDEKESE